MPVVPPVEPMLARLTRELPVGDDVVYEPLLVVMSDVPARLDRDGDPFEALCRVRQRLPSRRG